MISTHFDLDVRKSLCKTFILERTFILGDHLPRGPRAKKAIEQAIAAACEESSSELLEVLMFDILYAMAEDREEEERYIAELEMEDYF